MFKHTTVSSALAALMAAAVLSGCGGGNVPELVARPTTTGSDAQAVDAQAAKDALAKAQAAAQVATGQATRAAKAKAKAKANPADPAAAQAARSADAAVAYWRIITRFNLANAGHTNVTDGRTDQPAIPEIFRAAAGAFSRAHATEAAELRAYGGWPQSVKPSIDKFIAQKEIQAGYHLKMASAPDWAAWDKVDDQSQLGSKETARLSELIRQGLGLPPRG